MALTVYISVAVLMAVLFGCESSEEHSRKVRFGFRELNLPALIRNDRIRIENDQLEKDIGRLGKRQHGKSTQRDLHAFVLEQDVAALETANAFAEIWSEMRGSRDLQRRFSIMESQLDDAHTKCHDRSLVAKSLEDATAACAAFREIYIAVKQH
jgi:hypothetical protein